MPMAHTDGDIYVHFTQSNVLVAGDVVQPGRLPMLDFPTGGWIGGMQEAHRTLLRLANDTTKIVPASGPVMTKAEVQASLDLLTKVREQLVKLVKQGMGPQDLIDGESHEGLRRPTGRRSRSVPLYRLPRALGACPRARRHR